ncbi:MAG: DNA polymerase III subunit gamma/tau [Clostridia bacterium]
MSYIALYRKYRPTTFNEIVGQENVTKILKNQVSSGKISHAYIFSGTRGTGKTSAAKIFARAINCLNPQNGEPCNECEVCKSILDSSITDVVEMDAASNNSVENIRQIRQEVIYATIDVKYRVYIIDEVHMLTTSAFNALLKTLEEPPENVVFILATTEQHKIPVTILSRCLRFEFNKLSEEDISKRLEYVLIEESVKYEIEALSYIAKLADGALRDALSILDRCITETKEVLKYEDVVRIVGAIDKETINKIIKSILAYECVGSLELIDGIIDKGKDLRQFVSQIVEVFLDILVGENLENVDKKRLIYIIDRLSRLDNELKQTSKPAIVLKACIVELCSINDSVKVSGTNTSDIIKVLSNKIEELEKKVDDLKTTKELNIKNSINSTKTKSSINKNTVDNVDNTREYIEQNMIPFEDIENFKKHIIEKGKLKIYSALAGAKVYTTNDSIVIITTNSFAYNILKAEDSNSVISESFKEKYNISKYIRVELNEKHEDMTGKVEKLFQEKNVKYTPMD